MSAEEKRPGSKRLTGSEYEEAKLMWQRKGFPVKDIAAKFGITRGSLYRRFRKDGVVKNEMAKEESKAISESIVKSAARGASEIVARGSLLQEFVLRAADTLAKHTAKIHLEVIQGDKAVESMLADQKALNMALQNLRLSLGLCRDIMDQYIDLDSENLPVLTIRSLTEDDIERIQDEHNEEMDGLLGGVSTMSQEITDPGKQGESTDDSN